MIPTDKIIKIIWENIYPINQYKGNAQEEKPGSEKTRAKLRYIKIYRFICSKNTLLLRKM